ncbi:hypothetical protein GKQ38_02940 [Candidatus Nanohaloarchaea archaeon]|nr:hypothetical protein GKQ38_02940 [Candidatus Nanohaloarchaea archaeon]
MDRAYLEAATVFALSALAASMTYFIDISRPVTLVALLPITLVFGFTAYISKEGFNKASLAALPVLGFVFMGGPVAVGSVIAAIGTVLVSVFAGGDRFREYYGSTHLPLLFLGLILGASMIYVAMSNPQIENQLQNQTAEFLGQSGERIVNQSNLVSSQKNKQMATVRQTANATILYTSSFVINETKDDFSRQELQTLNSAFIEARSEVPQQLTSQISAGGSQIDISARISDAVRAQLQGKHFAIFIPVLVSLMIALQPLVGLATAIFAKGFDYAEENFSISSS